MITFSLKINKNDWFPITIDDVIDLFKQMLAYDAKYEYNSEHYRIDYAQNISITFNGECFLDTLVYSFTIENSNEKTNMYIYTDINNNTYAQYKQYKYKINTEGIQYVNKDKHDAHIVFPEGGENNE